MIKEIELNFPAYVHDEPLIYQIIKGFNVIPVIKEASFTTERGWAIIRFEGSEEELDRLIDYLIEEKGIEINLL